MKTLTLLLLLSSLTSPLAEAASLPRLGIDDSPSFIARALGRKKKQDSNRKDPYPKYFHEPDGDPLIHHYDSRYLKKQLSYGDKQDTQIHMMRAYLEFFRKNGLETWLAHGTLLGWWWNAKMLPWDWDIDTQVSAATLEYLAENHNATIYTYTSKADIGVSASTNKIGTLTRDYLLDINPAIWTRHHEKGQNIIDARWIDTRNGLYIDITGVAEMQPKEQPGVWSCKNFHEYRTRDLWPMRETYYEGVVAKVPYAYERMLLEEYGNKSLLMDEFEGHKWNVIDRVWVKMTQEEKDQQPSAKKVAQKQKYEEENKMIEQQWEKDKGLRRAVDIKMKQKEDKEREEKLKEADNFGGQYER